MPEDIYGIQPDPPRGGEGDRGDKGEERRGGQPPGESDRYSDIRRISNYHEETSGGGGGGGGGNAAVGWLVFILIFGVGNLILYNTVGWVIIPIRR
jgi:hypothetical protein